MTRFFDENRKTSLFGDIEDDSAARTDFNIINDTGFYQQDAARLPGMAAASFPEPEKYRQQTPDFSFDGNGTSGGQADHTRYLHKTGFPAEISPVKPPAIPQKTKPQDSSSLYRGSNRQKRNMDHAGAGSPAYNAVVRGLEKVERGDDDPRWFEAAEHLDSVFDEPSYNRLNAVSSDENRQNRNTENSPSFRAVRYGLENLEKDNARIRRVRQLEQVLKTTAQQARNQDGNAAGRAGRSRITRAEFREGFIL